MANVVSDYLSGPDRAIGLVCLSVYCVRVMTFELKAFDCIQSRKVNILSDDRDIRL